MTILTNTTRANLEGIPLSPRPHYFKVRESMAHSKWYLTIRVEQKGTSELLAVLSCFDDCFGIWTEATMLLSKMGRTAIRFCLD